MFWVGRANSISARIQFTRLEVVRAKGDAGEGDVHEDDEVVDAVLQQVVNLHRHALRLQIFQFEGEIAQGLKLFLALGLGSWVVWSWPQKHFVYVLVLG